VRLSLSGPQLVICALSTPRRFSLVSVQAFLNHVLQEFVDILNYSSPRTLSLDLEGMNLCREGTVSILTLLAHDNVSPDRLYLIDVHNLGPSAFTTSAGNSKSRTINAFAYSELNAHPLAISQDCFL
jgi:hypothetical protein